MGERYDYYHASSRLYNWLDVKTASDVTVNTILVIFVDEAGGMMSRNIDLELRVGSTAPTTTDSAVNTICRSSPTELSGWYQCGSSLTGNHVTIRKPGPQEYWHLVEILAYTEYSV